MIEPPIRKNFTDLLNQEEPLLNRLPIDYKLFTVRTEEEWVQNYNITKRVTINEDRSEKMFAHKFNKRISKLF
jgi:hypothetical protein